MASVDIGGEPLRQSRPPSEFGHMASRSILAQPLRTKPK